VPALRLTAYRCRCLRSVKTSVGRNAAQTSRCKLRFSQKVGAQPTKIFGTCPQTSLLVRPQVLDFTHSNLAIWLAHILMILLKKSGPIFLD
jgi:hypothetical protein